MRSGEGSSLIIRDNSCVCLFCLFVDNQNLLFWPYLLLFLLRIKIGKIEKKGQIEQFIIIGSGDDKNIGHMIVSKSKCKSKCILS